MKNLKSIAKGLLLLSLLGGAVIATPAKAEESGSKAYINAQASLKADALIKLDSSVGAVLGPNGVLRVLGAKVTSVSSNEVSATALYGNSALNFTVKADNDTKVNGSDSNSSLSNLKAGDKISFSGTIVSSSSSSIIVDADHIISKSLYNDKVKAEKEDSYKGEVQAVNTADNSLTLKLRDGRTVKVAVSSSTVITVDGAVKSLSAIESGDEVKVSGEMNSSSTVLSASKISVSDDSKDDSKYEDKDRNEDRDGRDMDRGGWLQRIRSWFSNR